MFDKCSLARRRLSVAHNGCNDCNCCNVTTVMAVMAVVPVMTVMAVVIAMVVMANIRRSLKLRPSQDPIPCRLQTKKPGGFQVCGEVS